MGGPRAGSKSRRATELRLLDQGPRVLAAGIDLPLPKREKSVGVGMIHFESRFTVQSANDRKAIPWEGLNFD